MINNHHSRLRAPDDLPPLLNNTACGPQFIPVRIAQMTDRRLQ